MRFGATLQRARMRPPGSEPRARLDSACDSRCVARERRDVDRRLLPFANLSPDAETRTSATVSLKN